MYQARLWLRAVAEQELEDTETGYLLDFVQIQAVTRQAAKQATQEESPVASEASRSLLAIIREL